MSTSSLSDVNTYPRVSKLHVDYLIFLVLADIRYLLLFLLSLESQNSRLFIFYRKNGLLFDAVVLKRIMAADLDHD